MTAQAPALDHDQLIEAVAFDDGFTAGWNAALWTAEARDEWIARRIIALLLQHDHNHALADMTATLKPYQERGIPRRVA